MSSSKVKIILLQYVASLGNKGTVHDVSVPYFNNVLKPKGLAKLADAVTINNHQQKQAHEQKELQARKKALQDMWDDIKAKGGLTIARQSTQMQHIYDKIDARDICQELLTKYQVKIDKQAIKMPHIIDTLGQYELKFEGEGTKTTFILDVVRK